MPFTVANKLPVKWVSLNALILSSSKYGESYDRLKVTHEIGLAEPLTADESFYIPPQGKPVDTRAIFPDGTIVNFAGQRVKDLQDEFDKYKAAFENRDFATAEQIHKTLMQLQFLSAVPYKAGQRVLTFEYELAIYPDQNGVFELNLWAPMPSFQVVSGGQVTTTIQLPTNNPNGFNAQILEVNAYQADNNGNLVGTIQPVINQDVLFRRIIVWGWQNDPYFTVKYHYQQ